MRGIIASDGGVDYGGPGRDGEPKPSACGGGVVILAPPPGAEDSSVLLAALQRPPDRSASVGHSFPLGSPGGSLASFVVDSGVVRLPRGYLAVLK
eukprot:SAG11_NODE_8105_length_1059_cov_23.908333_2_plen_95_part_00